MPYFETGFENKFVFDVSALPFLNEILDSMNRSNFPSVTVYLPDTLEKLLNKSSDDERYLTLFDKLIGRWTRRNVDTKLLRTLIREKKFKNITVQFVTVDDVDKELYQNCYNKIENKDLVTEFSAPFNLLGDLIGKILGVARRMNAYIIMANRHLLNEIKDKVSYLLGSASEFQVEKENFFERHLPSIRRTRGVRWMIGIALGGASIILGPLGYVGIVLAFFDP